MLMEQSGMPSYNLLCLGNESAYESPLNHQKSMIANPSLLRGKTVAVLGFNARPIACSAKNAGARVIVSDYWGDEDLDVCSSKSTSILSPKPGKRQRAPLEKRVHVGLAENLAESIENEDIDHVFVGSGFDDYTHSLIALEKRIAITGNSTAQMQRARNRSAIEKLTEKLGLSIPTTLTARTLDEAYSNCDKLGYPCIIRPPSSGGGSGISLVSDSSQVEAACWRLQADIESPELIVQQYIAGLDGSSCVLSTGSEAVVLSIQGQLIGMPSAGRNCDFVYSGNYMPIRLSESVNQLILESSEMICTTLRLQGTNGIDFVVDKNERVWFLEINPRFQGTLEMLERSGNISLTEMHIAACNGLLPSEIPPFSNSTKLVVFSRQNGKVPDLSKYENTVDRTPQGVVVHRGDPVCTVIETSLAPPDSYAKALSTSNAIQQAIK
ncbi:MAG: ATP-grasp domain-containing protein [Candidatus Thorarchaeota archaeon]